MRQPIVNFSIFSMEDFYHPVLVSVYNVFWEVSITITTVFFIFMIYVILKNSKDIGEYKYFMINQLVWSYLFDVIIGLWKPIPLWPFYMGYSIGFFKSWRGIWAIVPFYLFLIAAIGMGVAIFMSIVHRYIYIFPHSYIAKRYESVTVKLLFYGFIFIFMESIIMTPVFLSYVDTEVLRKSITSEYPFMEFFFENEPSIFGYNPDLNDQLTVLYMLLILIFLIGIILFCIGMYLNFLRLMKRHRHTVSQITYQMQTTLFKTLFIQIHIAFLFLILPLFLAIIFTAIGIRYFRLFFIIN